MNKNLKLGLIIGIPVLLIAIGLTLFLTLGSSGDKDNPDNRPTITLSQYEQLEKDMTYEQVVEILGSDGTLQSANGEKGEADYIATYIWHGKDENARAVITFNGNLLGAKTYVGLTD